MGQLFLADIYIYQLEKVDPSRPAFQGPSGYWNQHGSTGCDFLLVIPINPWPISYRSEINDDFSRNSQKLFSIPVHLTPTLRGSRWSLVLAVGFKN